MFNIDSIVINTHARTHARTHAHTHTHTHIATTTLTANKDHNFHKLVPSFDLFVFELKKTKNKKLSEIKT